MNESVNGHVWNPLTRKENNKKSTLNHNLLFNQSNEICKLKLSGIVFFNIKFYFILLLYPLKVKKKGTFYYILN